MSPSQKLMASARGLCPVFCRVLIPVLTFGCLLGFFWVPRVHLIGSDTFNNWDYPSLEVFLRNSGIHGRVYIDGARPYFVRRAIKQRSVYFYDLNPRARNISQAQNYSSIQRCFSPEYWIVAKLNRSQEDFDSLRSLFQTPIFSDKDVFVSKKLMKAMDESSPIDCALLRMKG